MNFALDINLIVNTVLLGISAWTLKTVVALDKKQAVSAERDNTHDREITELRVRVAEVETKVAEVELKLVELLATARKA